MGTEDFFKVELADNEEGDAKIIKTMERVASTIEGFVNPFILEVFEDQNFFNSLPEDIKNDENKLADLLLNSGKFWDIIATERRKRWDGDESGLLGREVHIEKTSHHDGRIREAESGYKINIEYLKSIGIDPKKVLFFRITQPSMYGIKPEYYWTSDYFETRHGLTREVSPEQRRTAFILVADLDSINSNGGLIQDINDDNGLAVRQIGTNGFDQDLAIAKIK